MKQFNIRLLAASVAALVSAGAAAETYTYRVIEAPDAVRDIYAVDINDQGLVALHAMVPTAAEFDFQYILASTRQAIGLSDEFDPSTDSLTRNQYYSLVRRLNDRDNKDSRDLRIAFNFAGEYNGQNVVLPALLNSEGNGASSQTNSADHQYFGLNQNNVRVGIASAPYVRRDHTFELEPQEGDTSSEPEQVTINYAYRDFTSRGLWFDGTNYNLIEPPEQEALGGESAIFDISDNNYAAGFVSVGITPFARARMDVCYENAESPTAALPAYNCIWNQWFELQDGSAANLSSYAGLIATDGSIYDMQAAIWQLDTQGGVVSAQYYPPLMERLEDDDTEMSTYAYAINNNGIAVGQSWTYWQGNDEVSVAGKIKMPAIYMNGETLPVTDDTDYVWGSATDINNDNIAVGFVMKSYQGYRRAVPFMYDVDGEEFATLPTFFQGSSTYPIAMNNQGIVVGSAEIDSSLNNTRRRVGFMYDINNPEQGLINLNDAIGCVADYYIASAEGINEQNQIVVTAVTEAEYIDDDGETIVEPTSRSLVLDPSSGELSNCTAEDDRIVREGGAISPFSLIAMLLIGGLITVRRKLLG